MATYDMELETRMRGPSLMIWIVCATVFVFILWAKFAWIDELVRGEGEVVSSSRPQIIQNLEGGILAELLVAEGDEVSPGDVIARLRGTQFATNVQDLSDKIDAANIRRLRLEAEIAGQFDFVVPEDLAQRAPDMLASERALLNARQSDYVSRVEGARRVLAEAERERDMLERMLERKIVALIEVTGARKAYSDADNRVNEIVTTAELERASVYSDTLSELASLRQEVRAAEDRLSRTTITSPMRGIVNALNVTTIGGVVRPGEEIAQIIPLGDELFVEAKIKPEDISNILPGQKATIKLSAYDYTIWGSLGGAVDFVSADTFKDERRPELPAHYKVSVKVDMANLSERQRQIAIRPGMLATVELHTGEKTVLQYLTKPLYRGTEALREP